MAAGRQNLSSKRYSTREEETRFYNNRFDHRSGRNDFVKSTGGRSEHRRDGYVEHSQFKQEYDREVLVRRMEDAVSKKRKFLPVVWDKADKHLKISVTSSVVSRGEDVGKVKDVASDSEIRISSVESNVSTVIDGVEVPSPMDTRSTDEYCDQEVENEEGEYVEERNLSKSKWAFNDSPRKETNGNSSSPESGEFKRDGSEGNDVSSLSVEDGLPAARSSEDEELENVDDRSSESDSDHEDSLCAGFGVGPSCRNVFVYERLGKISEGTYGVVFKAQDKKTGEIVALKKVKMGKDRDEGFPITALREINLLGELQHPHVVGLKEVVMDDFNGVYMVMDYIDHELKGYMERMKQPFGQSEVKCLMYQLLDGLSYLHDNYVIHRDLKTSNLLLNNKGELKICDFGMSRHYADPIKQYTSLVVTLWYRAPELLLGAKTYTTAVDMWSVGCIMAELLSKKPLFDGSKELEQVNKIFGTLGTPNDTIWPGYSKLPGGKSKFVKQPFSTLRKKFPLATFTGAPTLTELGFDLLSRLMTYDPAKRITAKEALNHRWFQEAPLPAEYVRICR